MTNENDGKKKVSRIVQKINNEFNQVKSLESGTPAERLYSLSDIDNDPSVATRDCVDAFSYIGKGDKNYDPNTPIGGNQ